MKSMATILGRSGRFASRPAVSVATLAALAVIGSGCSAWVPGVQMRWYTPPQSGPLETQFNDGDSFVRVKTSNFTPETAGRLTWEGGQVVVERKIDWTQRGDVDGNYTSYDLHPGEYEFEYQVPHTS